MNKVIVFALFALALVAAPAQTLLADDTPDIEQPSGSILLTVSGNITHTNGHGVADFDRAMLEGLQQHQVTMQTPWTDGEVSFQGFRVSDLMTMVGAEGREVVATALNDFSANIPFEDFSDRDVLIALEMNGEPMRVRDKGPLWVIYPVDPSTGELTVVDRDRMVWQLRSLTIR